MKISIVIVDSRSKFHPDWVATAISSAKTQSISVELIVVDNRERLKSIGKSFNEGVDNATGDWVMFLGDDDYLSGDYAAFISYAIEKFSKDFSRVVAVSSYMTTFEVLEDGNTKRAILNRPPMGTYKREYLLKYRFNEELVNGIDREYAEEVAKRGDQFAVVPYHYGYFYRQHDNKTCAFIDINKKPKEVYIVARYPAFIDPLLKKFGSDRLFLENHQFSPTYALGAKVVWSDWGDENAIAIGDFPTDATKILRIHAYEAYSHTMDYINFDAYDKIIFVAEHIRDYLKNRLGREFSNSIVIPNGINLKDFTLDKSKERNNKIAYAGYLTRKKGVELLLLLARMLPKYEFHIAGKYQENDVQQYMLEKKTDNIFMYPWQYKLNDWLTDKTYFISTSIREGCPVTPLQAMAAGLKPLIFDWIGADSIFNKELIWHTIDELRTLVDGDVNPEEYREFVVNNYDLDDMLFKYEAIIGEALEKK